MIPDDSTHDTDLFSRPQAAAYLSVREQTLAAGTLPGDMRFP